MKKVETSPVNKAAPVDELLNVMDELCVVMEEELAALKKQDAVVMRELLSRKLRLFTRYEASRKSLMADPNMLRKAPAGLREKVKVAGKKLEAVSQNNMRMLQGAVNGTRLFIQTVMSIMKKQVTTPSNYSNPRSIKTIQGTYSPTCQPVAVSRTA